MAITGLTDRSPSFKEIGRLRLGIPKSDMAKDASGPKEIPYFRPDFRPDAADSFAAFLAIYGEQPTEIHIRLPFPQIDRCWDAFYEVYNTAGMLGMADGSRWLYLRHNKTGELLVKDGMPIHAQGLPVDENGMAYLPFDKNTPVYSYKSKKGEDVAVYAKPTGRLKVLIPELKRAVFIQVITHSTYNCRKISSQLAGIEIIAQNAGMTLPMVPMVLSRRKELISVSINGKKSMQEHYLLNIEIDPNWMEAQFKYLDALMPGITPTLRMQLPQGEELEPEDVEEPTIENGEEIDRGPEWGSTFFTDKQPVTEVAQPGIPQPVGIVGGKIIDPNEPSQTLPTTANPYKKFDVTLEQAKQVTGSDGVKYGDVDDKDLKGKRIGIVRKLGIPNITPEERDELLYKVEAIDVLREAIAKNLATQAG
jgi:hypothetical protein